MLRRRLAFLEKPASFFYDGDRPLRAEEPDDPFRRGLLTIAWGHEPGRTVLAAATIESLDRSDR